MPEARRNLVDRTCEVCDVAFRARPDRAGRVCSRSCRAALSNRARAVRPADASGRRRYQRDRFRLVAYGLSAEAYDALLTAQGHRCAICRVDIADDRGNGATAAHVDHDHVSGQVRGILCALCNVGLGRFQDSPDRLRAAIEYLTRAGR